MIEINEIIDDINIFRQFYILREGYEFKPLTFPANIYDAIVIKNPPDIVCVCPKIVRSEHTLAEQIDFVNKYKLEKAYIVADDISFVTQCLSLKHLTVIPSGYEKDNFDFSPLYNMPQIKSLNCITEYGERNQFTSQIDYSRIKGLESLGISGKGHLNYLGVQTLKSLAISGYSYENLYQLFSSKVLDSLSMLCCKMKSLDGIENAPKMQCLYLDYNRSLKDISALRGVKHTLRALRIENCAKIEDFSVLCELEHLEFLELTGSNELKNLDFLKSLKNLKTFVFSVNVKDGDLTPCMKLSYARCLKNRKHYNLKDAELPKGEYVHGNESIESWRRIE